MKVNVEYGPTYALAIVQLQPNETIRAESGALVSMDTNVKMETSATQGGGVKGFLKGLARKFLAGESFFQNTFTAQGTPGTVTFAPTLVGDIMTHHLESGDMMITSSSYVAATPGITIDTKWGGARTFFGGEGLFMMKAHGTGDIICNAFGAIHPVQIAGKFIVDTGHIVAFESSLTFKVRRVGGWFSTFFSGEGLVCEFSGNGRLWMQSRNPKEFGSLVGSKLPPREG